MEQAKGKNKNSLTIGQVTFRTSGNILFSSSEEDDYYLAESSLLDKFDEAINAGILENGMQAFLKKIKS